MDSSDSLKDWDVINLNLIDNTNDEYNLENENTDLDNHNIVVSEIEEKKIDQTSDEPCVSTDVKQIVEDYVDDCHNSTGSEIDIIDENVDEISGAWPPLNMEYSFNSHAEDLPLPPCPPPPPTPPSPTPPPYQEEMPPSYQETPPEGRRPFPWRTILNFLTSQYWPNIVFSLSMVLVSVSITYKGTLYLHHRLTILENENSDIKNQVLTKIEDDRVVVALEEQVNALKNENSKLSSSLQNLIRQLEEQTSLFKKEHATKPDPYKEEIEELKEQVNLLQIDNEDLQKQVVRMRYGAHSNPSFERKVEDKEESENLNEAITSEIRGLKKQMLSEVRKLQNWKESIHELIAKLHLRQEAAHHHDLERHNFKGGEFDDEEAPPKKSGKKGKRFYDWSWKDLRKNFKGTFDSLPNINVSDMLSKYVTVNKKKVESVFESVGHYFKKAQEKTKKILNKKDGMTNDVWDFLGDMRKRWSDMKNEFFERNYGKGSENDEARTSKKHKKYNQNFKKQDFPQDPTVDPDWDIPSTQEDSDIQENESGEKAWVFERASHRSEIREHNDKESTPNWFLRKGKEDELWSGSDSETTRREEE